VERALRAEDLAYALGEHAAGILPTADELTQLIADVEIGAFQQEFSVGPELLRTAWYLHGVASAPPAAELYTVTRQRRAFAVSAHIFDLALADDTISAADRLTLAFAAQVGYRRSNLDPNATAIYRRVATLLSDDDPVTTHAASLALEAGVAFLGLDTPSVTPLLRIWRRQLNELADTVEVDDLTGGMFGPSRQVVFAVSALFSYLRSGDRNQFEIAHSLLTTVIDQNAGIGDLAARWVAAHLLMLTDGLETASVWALLPPDLPPGVGQAFTLGSPPVMTLWPPQRELLQRIEHNPLDPATSRLLLSVPTSAGKTLLAQLIICAHVATQPGDVCYVTPLRSLGREMRQALRSRLRMLDKTLGRDLPDESSSGDPFGEEEDDARGDVEVMTPERLMQLLRHDPDGVRSRFSLFVVDEAQLLAQPERGFLLESLLTYLNDGPARLVLLSAVLGNGGGLASWLDPSAPEVLFTSQWRGPRRMHVILSTVPDWNLKTVRERPRATTHNVQESMPLRAKLRLRPAEGRTVELTTTEPVGTLVLNRDPVLPVKRDSSSTANYQVAASMAAFLLQAGSLLMIVSTRDTARRAARALAEVVAHHKTDADRIETEGDAGTSVEVKGHAEDGELNVAAAALADLNAFVTGRLGADHPLVPCLEQGVAYHHAGLPIDVLDALEEALRTGTLSAVVATSTLSEGVNLPVRTVLISETANAAIGALGAARLLNAIGRAGRAGKESEGWIVLALQRGEADSDFGLLTPTDEALAVQSSLLGAQALDALAMAEQLIADSADALMELPARGPREFTTYVWFLLSAFDRLDRLLLTIDLDAELGKLLAFTQMSADIRQRWLSLADRIRDRYASTPPDVRRRWAATGTCLATAQTLDLLTGQVVTVILDRVRRDPVLNLVPEYHLSLDETMAILGECDVFAELLERPEAGLRPWRFRPTRGHSRRIPDIDVPLATSLASWLAGREMPDLAADMLPNVDADWRLEQAVDAVSSVFEHYFSWTVGVLVDQINTRLENGGATSRLRPDLAWCIRYGVDTSQALSLLTTGIRSRRLAHAVGRRANADGVEITDLREWLASMHITGWRDEFDASPREILDLLEFTRAPRRSLLRDLLRDGRAELPITRTGHIPAGFAGAGTAQVEPPEDPPGELRVLEDDVLVGVISAQAHADVESLLSSGLDLELRVEGDVLVFSLGQE